MRESDKKYFEIIYSENYTRLYYFALNITGDSEASKDILNDVFTGLWKRFAQLDKANIKTYLTTAVRNRTVDHLRQNVQRAKYNEDYISTLQASIILSIRRKRKS